MAASTPAGCRKTNVTGTD